MSGDFFQLGYVTSDFDRAMKEMRELHAIGLFKVMRELHLPTGPGREAVAHYGLAFKNDLQFEIIAPLAGDIGVYRDLLPQAGFGLRFHHLGRHVPSSIVYRDLVNQAGARWNMPVNHGAFGGFYAYADARKDLGHFLEYFHFPNEEFFADVPRF